MIYGSESRRQCVLGLSDVVFDLLWVGTPVHPSAGQNLGPERR